MIDRTVRFPVPHSLKTRAIPAPAEHDFQASFEPMFSEKSLRQSPPSRQGDLRFTFRFWPFGKLGMSAPGGSTFDRIQSRCYTPARHERRSNRSVLVRAPERMTAAIPDLNAAEPLG